MKRGNKEESKKTRRGELMELFVAMREEEKESKERIKGFALPKRKIEMREKVVFYFVLPDFQSSLKDFAIFRSEFFLKRLGRPYRSYQGSSILFFNLS